MTWVLERVSVRGRLLTTYVHLSLHLSTFSLLFVGKIRRSWATLPPHADVLHGRPLSLRSACALKHHAMHSLRRPRSRPPSTIYSFSVICRGGGLARKSVTCGRSAKKVPRVHLVADTMWNCAAAALLLLLLAVVQGKHHCLIRK